jgi:kinesin family protein 4/21/27
VLGEESSQVDLYDVTGRDVVEEYMKGHNVTFLA